MNCRMKLMKKEKRKKEIKLRKNFFLTFLLTFFLWVFLGGLIYFTEPNSTGVLILFFILAFLSLTFTFSIIFANTRRGIITSIFLTLFLLLRYLGVGHILNFLLLAGIGIAFDFYFKNR